MKKFFVYSALILGLFLLCLSTSLLFKKTLDLDGDYLSAFATLVAAMVAFLLFNDWKVEHKFRLLEQYHINLKERSAALFNQLKIAHMEFSNIVGSRVETGYTHFSNGFNELNTFINELNRVELLIREYQTCLSTFEKNEVLKTNEEKLTFHKNKLSDIYAEYRELVTNNMNNIDINTISSSLLYTWIKILKEFDFYCSVELSEFYFQYLNSDN